MTHRDALLCLSYFLKPAAKAFQRLPPGCQVRFQFQELPAGDALQVKLQIQPPAKGVDEADGRPWRSFEFVVTPQAARALRALSAPQGLADAGHHTLPFEQQIQTDAPSMAGEEGTIAIELPLEAPLAQLLSEPERPPCPLLQRFMACVENNLSDPRLGIPMLCEELPIKERTLARRVKAHTGQSIGRYIFQARMALARQLLLDHRLKISEVAYRVGYRDPNTFCRYFKKETGLSPSRFKAGAAR